MYEFSERSYDMIFGGYLLKQRGLNLNLSKHFIKGGDRMLERCTSTMVNLGMYVFKNVNADIIKPNNVSQIHS